MPYIYVRVDDLENHEKVGTKQCVALIQTFTDAGMTASWRQGAAVLGNKAMLKGTAIATFVRGRYPNQAHGNHAAFFLRHGPNGFWVMDQWLADQKKVSRRDILNRRGGLRTAHFGVRVTMPTLFQSSSLANEHTPNSFQNRWRWLPRDGIPRHVFAWCSCRRYMAGLSATDRRKSVETYWRTRRMVGL